MLWQDILVHHRLTHGQIAAAISGTLLVQETAILVVDEIRPDLPFAPTILVEVTETAGDFPLMLSIYTTDEGTSTPGVVEGTARFASLCGCPCLISDSSVNPYSMLLVLPDGSSTPVTMDAAQLEQGRYSVTSKNPKH